MVTKFGSEAEAVGSDQKIVFFAKRYIIKYEFKFADYVSNFTVNQQTVLSKEVQNRTFETISSEDSKSFQHL